MKIFPKASIFIALLFVLLCFANNATADVFRENGFYGIKNSWGEVTVPPRYDDITQVGWEPIYIVKDRYGYFLMHESGRIYSRQYRYMQRLSGSDDLIEVQCDRYLGDYGLIDYNGNQILPCKYNYIEYLNDEYIVANYKGYEGVIDFQDNIIIPFKYDNIAEYDYYLLEVRLGNKYGLINYYDEVILDIVYSDLFAIDDDIVAVKANGARGAMKLDHTQIIPVQYKNVSEFKNDYIRTKTTNNFYGLYSKTGKRLLADKYNKIELKNGYFIVKEGKLYGLVNTQGAVLTPSKYSKIKYHKKKQCFQGKVDKIWYDLKIIKK